MDPASDPDTLVSNPPESGGIEAQASGGAQVFNRQAFIDRMIGDEVFAHRIAGAFCHGLPGMLGEVRESVKSGSTESLRNAIHKIKGSAGNVGGEALSSLARRIELNETHEELPNLIAELEFQADLLMKALLEWTI